MSSVALLRDRFALSLIAGALLAVGVVALFWPVKLNDYDRWGFRIDCGTGFASSFDQAALSDRQPPPPPRAQGGYVDGCRSAVLWRRAWGASLIGLGGGGVVALLPKRERNDVVAADGSGA